MMVWKWSLDATLYCINVPDTMNITDHFNHHRISGFSMFISTHHDKRNILFWSRVIFVKLITFCFLKCTGNLQCVLSLHLAPQVYWAKHLNQDNDVIPLLHFLLTNRIKSQTYHEWYRNMFQSYWKNYPDETFDMNSYFLCSWLTVQGLTQTWHSWSGIAGGSMWLGLQQVCIIYSPLPSLWCQQCHGRHLIGEKGKANFRIIELKIQIKRKT